MEHVLILLIQYVAGSNSLAFLLRRICKKFHIVIVNWLISTILHFDSCFCRTLIKIIADHYSIYSNIHSWTDLHAVSSFRAVVIIHSGQAAFAFDGCRREQGRKWILLWERLIPFGRPFIDFLHRGWKPSQTWALVRLVVYRRKSCCGQSPGMLYCIH